MPPTESANDNQPQVSAAGLAPVAEISPRATQNQSLSAWLRVTMGALVWAGFAFPVALVSFGIVLACAQFLSEEPVGDLNPINMIGLILATMLFWGLSWVPLGLRMKHSPCLRPPCSQRVWLAAALGGAVSASSLWSLLVFTFSVQVSPSVATTLFGIELALVAITWIPAGAVMARSDVAGPALCRGAKIGAVIGGMLGLPIGILYCVVLALAVGQLIVQLVLVPIGCGLIGGAALGGWLGGSFCSGGSDDKLRNRVEELLRARRQKTSFHDPRD